MAGWNEDRRYRSHRLHPPCRSRAEPRRSASGTLRVGQKVDARVTQFDRKTHKVGVSIKALEVAEEKEAMAQYGPPIPARRWRYSGCCVESSAPARPMTKPKGRRIGLLPEPADADHPGAHAPGVFVAVAMPLHN